MLISSFFFHPDLIRATSLNDKLKITVFSITKFQKHLSDKEKNFIGVFKKKSNLKKKILMYIANTYCINNRIIIKLLLKILWQTNDYKKPNKQINNYSNRKYFK
jgi:hypothetical protein